MRIEHDYRELKTGLGLDHFEGRSWIGWHRHVTLTATAQLFLTRRRSGRRAAPGPGRTRLHRRCGRSDILQAIGAFAGLFFLAAYVIIDSRHLMSNYCFDATKQIVCPISGPDWARPLPSAATLIGLLIGLAGLAIGRPIRAGALISGFVFVVAALVGSWVIG